MILIKGGTVIGPTGAIPADVLVVGEQVSAIFAPDQGPAEGDFETLDATGKYVIPGAVDAHTHMELPFGGTFAWMNSARRCVCRTRLECTSPKCTTTACTTVPFQCTGTCSRPRCSKRWSLTSWWPIAPSGQRASKALPCSPCFVTALVRYAV